jgi:hypothetical protein
MVWKLSRIVYVVLIVALLASCTSDGSSEPDALSAPTSKENNAEPEVYNAAPDVSNFISGEVTVIFDYQKQLGAWSNQFAIWIEDMDGQLVKTLYATAFTATGGYAYRQDSIALWVEKSGLSSMTKAEVDAITSATPLGKFEFGFDEETGKFDEEKLLAAENLSYTWDLTDANGNAVLPGEYKFFVEGTLRQKNFVLYSGVIEIGGASTTVQADAQFTYKASSGLSPQEALTSDAVENSMIRAVTAIFVPFNSIANQYN